MCTPGPVRALAQAMAIAFAALSFSEALAEPTESLETGRHPDPVRLAAIDPKTPNSGEPGSASAEPFGLIALRAREGELWRKWRGVQHEISRESELLALCRASPGDCPSAPARRFLAIIETARTRQGRARLGEINRAINRQPRVPGFAFCVAKPDNTR